MENKTDRILNTNKTKQTENKTLTKQNKRNYDLLNFFIFDVRD